ncbi:MAG TPA: imidazolonepropionase [Symbiobacteriaceae bacterium]|nr:imidazolonepropionase [Symbiobacteriaceae bacterium]
MEVRPQAQWLSDVRPPEALAPEADLLIINAGELVTMAGGPRKGARMKDVGVIKNGALAAYQGNIYDVGPTEEVLARVQTGPTTRVVDARGRAVIPGFVDPHTHLCFAGDRADEFALRLQGATYTEIAAKGGGIMSTVKATRQATEPALLDLGLKRLDAIALTGTTTVEIKSGYGLTSADEIKMLRAIRTMAERHALDIVPTFMGAHELAPEYKQDREGYIRLICDEMLPLVVAEPGLAAFCDVFTEKGVFTVEESRRILQRGKQLGLRPKVHADELSDLGGAALAAEVGAVSADHLLFASEENLAAMARAGVVAVCLPGTAFCLMNVPYANARKMIDVGCFVAIASDFNPGSCPAYSIPFIITLACMHMKMDPSEALAAATINAALAIGMETRVGSLEIGKQADIVILDGPSHRSIPYKMGQGCISSVIKRGRLLVDEGRLLHRGAR